jgi:hypothetical protein
MLNTPHGKTLLAVTAHLTRRRVRCAWCFYHINDSRGNSLKAVRAANAVAQNLAHPLEECLTTTDIKPRARSKCRRRPRSAPRCRRHARGGGRVPVLLPVRALNRLWFGPTKHFRVDRYMAIRLSIDSDTLPKWVYGSESLLFLYPRTQIPDIIFVRKPCPD